MLELLSESPIPFPLILPTVSLLLLAAAGLFAFHGWWSGQKRAGETVTSWDIAAALTFLGCAAAIFGEIEHVIEYFWMNDTRTKPANG